MKFTTTTLALLLTAAGVSYASEGMTEKKEIKQDIGKELTQEEKAKNLQDFLKALGKEDLYARIQNNFLLDNQLSLSLNDLTSVPPELGNLTNLKELDLQWNRLTSVPPELGNLKNLTLLYLSYNRLTSVPPELGNLKNLTLLYLSYNRLTSVPPELGNLTNLKELDLQWNRLTSVPPELGNLKNLTKLNLANNQLTSVPPELGNLTNLTLLNLASNQLTSVPPELGNIKNLTKLNLSNNQLTSLPKEIHNLKDTLILLDLRDNPIQEYGDGENLGKRELRQIFGDRVVFSQELKNIVKISKEQVYENLAKEPLHLDLKTLKDLKLPELPQTKWSGKEMLEVWQNILSSLNFEDPKEPGYLSYDLLAGNYGETKGENPILIIEKLLPRLNGFLKTLWGEKLLEGESSDWPMYESQKPDLRNALAFILTAMDKTEDPDVKSMLFGQLVNGLLHCPTGQKEGVDSVVLTLLSQSNKTALDLGERVKNALAFKKNEVFKMAILPGENNQNVHILSFYGEKLRDELGLYSSMPKYQEKIGTFNDPFQGSVGNALEVFFMKFSPKYLIHWLQNQVETKQDHELFQEIEKLKGELIKPNVSSSTTGLSENELLKQIKGREDDLVKAEKMKQFDETEEEEKETEEAISKIKNDLDGLKKQLETLKNKGKTEKEEISIEKTETKESVEGLKKKIDVLENKHDQILQYERPFTMIEVINYLIGQKLMKRDKKGIITGWETFFNEDPILYMENKGFPTLTEEGAEKILIHLKILEKDKKE